MILRFSPPRSTRYLLHLLPLSWLLLLLLSHPCCSEPYAADSPPFRLSGLYNLSEYLLDTGYRSHVRPVLESGRVTNVTLKLNLLAVDDVDIKQQILQQSLYFDIFWQDEFLMWDPEDFDGVQNTFVKQKQVWVPDLVVEQYVGFKDFKLGDRDALLQVIHDGTMMWSPDLTHMETSCSVDITFYPYDQHTCSFKLHPWVTDMTHMTLASQGVTGFFDGTVSPNSQWEVVRVTNTSCDFSVEGYQLSCIQYSYTLRRRSLFPTLVVVLPTLLLSLLSTTVFWLPAESGEKVSLSMTLLLAYVFLLSILMDVLPQSSLHTSILLLYLLLLCSCSSLSVLLTVVVISLHSRQESGLPFPAWSLAFARCGVARSRGSVSAAVVADESEDGKGEGEGGGGGGGGGKGRGVEGGGRKGRGEGAVTWVDVAKGCDYVFSRLFLFVILVASLVCFAMLVLRKP